MTSLLQKTIQNRCFMCIILCCVQAVGGILAGPGFMFISSCSEMTSTNDVRLRLQVQPPNLVGSGEMLCVRLVNAGESIANIYARSRTFLGAVQELKIGVTLSAGKKKEEIFDISGLCSTESMGVGEEFYGEFDIFGIFKVGLGEVRLINIECLICTPTSIEVFREEVEME